MEFSMLDKPFPLFIYLEFYRKPALNFEFYFANGGLAC
jgi:hypothetical protein